MIYKSLILGVLFSIGIFAVKSGVGIAYVLGQKKRKRDILFVLLLYILAYGALFGIAAWALPRIDPAGHLAAIQAFIGSGMIVHLALAAVMMIWGVVLLKGHKPSSTIDSGRSRAWLILALPCPVCMTVILFSSAFLITCFPDHPQITVFALYLAFIVVGLASMGLVGRVLACTMLSSEAFLGSAMLLVATYFLLSVTVMPQFGDLDKVYRLACCPGDGSSPRQSHLMGMIVVTVLAFGAGFGGTIKKLRRLT
jgi:predicted transporter